MIKNTAKPLRKIIPIKLRILSQIAGCDCLSKYLPDTSLKLKIAITGAIRNETVVAKSTNSFNLFSNRKITKRAPTT